MQAPAIHQILAGYSPGDAISNEARILRDLFRNWGMRSEIYCDPSCADPRLSDSLALEELRQLPAEEVAMLHLSVGSPANEMFPQLRCRKVIRYHNITPGHFFQLINPQTARLLDRGRRQLEALKGSAELCLADSAYNASELVEAGYDNVHVHPLHISLNRVEAAADASLMRDYSDGKVNILFVGRLVPNKCIEDLIHAFYYFQTYVEPRSRLIHVGSYAGSQAYRGICMSLEKKLGLRHVEHLGSVTEEALAACYQVSDLFLCMSEHEGFGIPLLEAMQAKLPVMAYASAAVPETMDGAGLLFEEKHFDAIAQWMGRLASPGALRDGVLATQEQRLQRFRQRDLVRELQALLEEHL